MRWVQGISSIGLSQRRPPRRPVSHKSKGRQGALSFSHREASAEIGAARATTNLRQLSKGKLNNFFFLFKNLLYDLFHLILRPLRSILIRGKATRFSADKRVGLNVTVTCQKRQAPRWSSIRIS